MLRNCGQRMVLLDADLLIRGGMWCEVTQVRRSSSFVGLKFKGALYGDERGTYLRQKVSEVMLWFVCFLLTSLSFRMFDLAAHISY